MSTTAVRTSSERPSANRPGPVVSTSIGANIDPIRVLRQNQWKLVVATVLGIFLGGASKVMFDRVYPLFNGAVLFELRPPLNRTDNVNTTEDRTEEAVERLGQTESARLLSRALLDAAMRSRDIETTTWSQKFRDESDKFLPDDAVDALLEELTASHRRRTQYFSLSWSTNDPRDVPVVLNKIAETYIQVKKQADDKRFSDNRTIFADQLKVLDNDLTNLSRDISEFIRANNITSLDTNANELVVAMQEIGRNVGVTQGQGSIAQSRRDQTKAKLEGQLAATSEDIRKAEEDQVIMRMSTNLKEISVAMKVAEQNFGPTHPEYRRALRTFEAAEAERDAEMKRIIVTRKRRAAVVDKMAAAYMLQAALDASRGGSA